MHSRGQQVDHKATISDEESRAISQLVFSGGAGSTPAASTNSSALSVMEPRFAIAWRESPAVLWIKRVCVAVVCVHLVFSAWSAYRRIWQVLRIELHASSLILTPGETVSYDVITSGETHNRILLELVQGTNAETLLEQHAQVNTVNTYDPRVFEYARTVTITPEVLARFAPGPATLRLTGFGGQKLLRTPPPRVRELAVRLRR